MTDETHGQRIRDAANLLAKAMNEAGQAGLHLKLEMRPHNRDDDGKGGVKIYGYLPIISISRIILI